MDSSCHHIWIRRLIDELTSIDGWTPVRTGEWTEERKNRGTDGWMRRVRGNEQHPSERGVYMRRREYCDISASYGCVTSPASNNNFLFGVRLHGCLRFELTVFRWYQNLVCNGWNRTDYILLNHLANSVPSVWIQNPKQNIKCKTQ